MPLPDQNWSNVKLPVMLPKPVNMTLLNYSLSVPEIKSVMVSLLVESFAMVLKTKVSLPRPPVSVSFPA